MPPLLCIVLEIDETAGSNRVTLGIPDESNQITVQMDDDAVAVLKAGAQFSLPMVPFVTQDHPAASMAIIGTPPDALVPVEHPSVITPSDAAMADEADASQVIAPPPVAVPDPPPVAAAPDATATSDTTVIADPTAAAAPPAASDAASAGS